MNDQPERSRQEEDKLRLGIDHSIPGIDSHLVHPFAKTTRIIGVIMVASLLSWGLFYSIGYGYRAMPPFKYFFYNFLDFDRPAADLAQWSLALAIALFGWFKRFTIGAIGCAIIFGVAGAITKLFKKI